MSNRSGNFSHIGQNQGQPEVQVIKLHKSTNGMGLSIVAAKVRVFFIILIFKFYSSAFKFSLFQGAGQDRLGIYIKSVVAGGAADTVNILIHLKIVN